ncbi:MAG: stalk domain-containing protein [Firmicutes bacterium]|nr:stalk domain-containing protein [Bacillota bacterium]
MYEDDSPFAPPPAPSRRKSLKRRAAALISLALSFSMLPAFAPAAVSAEDGRAAAVSAEAGAAAPALRVLLDGAPVNSDAAPYIDANNRAMIPVRVIGEALGAKVDWDEASKTVIISKASGGTVSLQIGGRVLTVAENGGEILLEMDTAAVISSGRTFVPVRFIAQALGLTVGWDAGARTVSLSSQAPAAAPDVTSPSAITVTEESVTVDAGAGYPLGGTLSIPKGAQEPYPCVVLVSGSGPNDRDETINSDKPFKDIADYLASKGIAALRYDKRTKTYGAKMIKELGGSLSVNEEYVEDAVAASKLAKADPRIDASRVFIAGHSEGGMLAPRIEAAGGDFAGIIIMAGSPRNLDDIMYDQLMAQAELYKGTADYDLAMAQMAKIRQGFDSIKAMTDEEAKNTDMSTILGGLGGGASAYYFKEMDDRPAAGYIAKIDKPFLIMQGMSDIQIYPEVDFKAYKELFDGRANAVFKSYDGLTHLFMTATENDTVGNPKAYTTPEHVDAQVLRDIADWINAR